MEVKLTPREQEVKRMLAQHMSAREIATRLGISVSVAYQHIQHIRQRLDAAKRRERENHDT